MKDALTRLLPAAIVFGACCIATPAHGNTVAREWTEEMLEAIRNDFARPVVHARNLFHVSVAMYDGWAVYDDVADTYLTHEHHEPKDVAAARNETISFAAYRVLRSRFLTSPGAAVTIPALDAKMDQLTNDLSFVNDRTFGSIVGDSAAAIGNRIAVNIITGYQNDGANQAGDYANQYYLPVNDPLLPDFPGNPDITDTNRWQPLALQYFIDQSGNPVPTGYPEFLGPEWGAVVPFSLQVEDLTIYNRDNFDYWIYHDPGPPPYIGTKTDAEYKWGFEMVSAWSSHLDPNDGVMWDISPASIGNAALATGPSEYEQYYDWTNGGDWGTGYAVNPVTGQPYTPQIVPRGDYTRILAEFWADGPDSETPPGHWYTILNYVADHPSFEKRIGGVGPILPDLEWEVKAYLAMGGAMHDVAIASWGVKGWYDYLRPISALRYMADQGQCSDDQGPSYDVNGLNLEPDLIEVVTADSTMPGERHEHLSDGGANIGKIAVYAWRGHDFINDPETDEAGVGWILAENWWPYQRPSFVTPPFAGYVSGHSTYSRAAAELMELLTGTPYFPDGLGEFYCPQDQFLVFEDGPSMDVTLQWATYHDASDQCSLSRIWGGIHPPADDVPGRIMGKVIGPEAYSFAEDYFSGWISCPSDLSQNRSVDFADILSIIGAWGPCSGTCPQDLNGDGEVGFGDILEVIGNWGSCP
ncbi:MAG: vanadium-dependent haloperoxidase [Planctomycetota bacterium]|jgi:hypothetical protein